MKYFIPSFSGFSSRNRRGRRLIAREGATYDEWLEALFGVPPDQIQGLEKDEARDDIVGIKGVWEDPHAGTGSHLFSTFFRLAYIRSDKPEREIYLNRLLLSPLGHGLGLFATRQGWARFRDLIELFAGDWIRPIAAAFFSLGFVTSFRYALLSSVTKLFTLSVTDEITQKLVLDYQSKSGKSHLIKEAFQAVANDMVNSRPQFWDYVAIIARIADTILTTMPVSHFNKDSEIQARLAVTIIHGYKKWGRLPQVGNDDELYAALYDAGIKTPAKVKRYLRGIGETPEDHDALRDVRATFSRKHDWIWETLTNPGTAEINLGLSVYHRQTVLEFYWQYALPFFYADLHYMWGDSKAFEKAGFDLTHRDTLGLPPRNSARGLPAPRGPDAEP